MSLVSFYVNSLDVSLEVNSQTISIRKTLTSHASVANFIMTSPITPPVEGNDVKVYLGTDILFAGVIDTVVVAYATPNLFKYTCSCSDYRRLLDQKLVAETYLAGTEVNDIILGNHTPPKDITGIIEYAPVGFSAVGITGSPAITIAEDLVYNYQNIGDAIIELVNTVMGDFSGNVEFYVDENKVVRCFLFGTGNPSPYDITDSTLQSIFSNFNISCDHTQVRNQVLVMGGYKPADTSTTFTYWGDGVSRSWKILYYPHDPTLSVDGVPNQTLGIENVDPDDGTYDYFYNYYEKVLKCATLTSTPGVGIIIELTYKYEIPILVRIPNTVSQNMIAAVEGGDGIYEYVIKDSAIASTQQAINKANAELVKNSWPVIRGSVQAIDVSGFKEGQRIEVNITNFRYNGIYIIDDLEIESLGNNLLLWTVNFRGQLFP